MALTKIFSWIVLLLSFFNTIIPTTSTPTYLTNDCANTTTNTFANNSMYQTNLNTLFHSLSNATSNPTGFYATSTANGTTDTIYGLFLCRGDLATTDKCKDCVEYAISIDLPITYCPNCKVAYISYYECMLRYSNQPLLGIMQQIPNYFLAAEPYLNGDDSQFTELLGDTMNFLVIEAASTRSGKKYATKSEKFNSSYTLYTMAQCTPDLTTNDCDQCLTAATYELTLMVEVKLGALHVQPSCSIRYETYKFYRGPLNDPSLPSPRTNSTVNGKGPRNISSPPSPGTNSTASKGKGIGKASKIVEIVVPTTVLVLLISSCTYHFRKKAKKYFSLDVNNAHQEFTTAESLMFELKTLQTATNYFADDQKLGGGGFGNVYKGTLPSGQEIAVKRLTRLSEHGLEAFKNEAILIAKLQHKNLVRILGFCSAREERLLVYEFVPQKSLDYLLFDSRKQGELDWPMRYNIVIGIARGLLYLHEDSRPRIIHRDLKAPNILLENDMNPKISDFGLARIFKIEQAEDATSIIAGTYGYMAPEYAMHGQFSIKSDVYSFGVLLLEIISGKKIHSRFPVFEDGDLLTYAWKCWKEEKALEFMDPTLIDSYSTDEVLRCIHLGLLCVQENSHERPTMSTIVFMLNTDSNTDTLPKPQCPRSFYRSNTDSSQATAPSNQHLNMTTTSTSSVEPNPYSHNRLTVSEMSPR